MAGRLKQLSAKFHGAASDSILLTFVRVITAVLGLLVTKLLSIHFSLHEYGTYSQAMLIVTTATSISIFGLTNAVNYFYNAAADEENKERYFGTIFSVQYFIGTLCAITIIAIQIPIINYFKNEDLKSILYLVAWFPLLQNLIPMLQVLFVSIGRAKLIAGRNFIISVARLGIVLVACYITKSIRTVFAILLLLDIAQVTYFMWAFGRGNFRISIKQFDKSLLKPILTFSIPMAVYVLTNELARDIDKYVISFFSDTSTLAIYTNAAKLLPFDLITQSFITVLVPIVTRQIASQNFDKAQTTFRAYLRLGYVATWLVAFGVVINAKEAMLFLYDPKYLPGLSVFIIYLFVDMIKFANTSLILTAKGKSKTLMICSLSALASNFVLNIILFRFFGILGPAVATLIITFGLVSVLLVLGGKEIQTSIFGLFDWKEMAIVACELIVVGGGCYFLKGFLYSFISSSVIILIVTYVIYISIMLLLNRKRILDCFRTINRMK